MDNYIKSPLLYLYFDVGALQKLNMLSKKFLKVSMIAISKENSDQVF